MQTFLLRSEAAVDAGQNGMPQLCEQARLVLGRRFGAVHSGSNPLPTQRKWEAIVMHNSFYIPSHIVMKGALSIYVILVMLISLSLVKA